MTVSASRKQPRTAPGTKTRATVAGVRLAPIVAIFLIALVIPFIFQIGPLRFSAYRVVLFLTILPFLAMWLMGRAGRVRMPDIALLLFCFWAALSFGVIHGAGTAIEAGGIIFIETMGAYLLGRLFVRTPDDLHRVVRLLFWILIALLPLAVIESITGRSIALELSRAVQSSYRIVTMEPRWGFRRAQSVFEHPILFGVFCSGFVALTYYVLGHGRSLIRRWLQTGAVIVATVTSLSSGPMTAMAAQVLLIGWDRVFKSVRQRWAVLGGLALAGFAVISLFSNRSPAQILISFVAFNPSTAWNRLRIWEHGSASVMNNPLFGIGRNDWERPMGMVSSVDMFWLLPAMRHGLLAGVLLQVVFFGIVLAVLFRKGLSARWADYRKGYLISLAGLFMAGWTVHYWNTVYVFFMFLLGCGSCFLTDARDADTATEPVTSAPVRRQGLALRRTPAVKRPAEPDTPAEAANTDAARPQPRYSRPRRPPDET
ncbi:hypothetical protein LHP98_17090 [Rhodobacter sp. Har01]|uniref:O-antigen ligase family protein n=1 Tax=Rhodobacter sp. Har01 TaxID=2883999 RepID=UPI001D0604D1|nr:O-antigen ligase family protein [Rhodobacter sp. Har01]MCB6179839.1 hypothetical protein [Rhodobacter sp. Har01]